MRASWRIVRRVGRPDLIGTAARTAVAAGKATAVAGSTAAHQRQRAAAASQQQEAAAAAQEEHIAALVQEQVAATPVPQREPSEEASGISAELQNLASLHQQGILDDAEFTAAKNKLLS